MSAALETLRRYLVLPQEVTEFERGYLGRAHRIAAVFLALHVPAFALLAWVNDSGPVALAASLTTLVVAGPLLVSRWFDRPRWTSRAIGVASMALGGLLVHFGRGPWITELHFYFVVGIALLSVFGDPLVNLGAALTVVVHHAAMWFFLPESAFSREAPFASVPVHGLFVAIESVAACYVARTYFDSVLGLERTVAERSRQLDRQNRELVRVLDTVRQGLAVVSADGALAGHHSRALAEWFGAPAPGERIWDYFAPIDATFASWLDLGWSALADGALPAELALAQLPATLVHGGRTFELQYQPTDDDGQVLVSIADVTERVARERTEALQRELLAVLGHVTSDRASVVDFLDETSARIEGLAEDPTRDDAGRAARDLHTVKANAAAFGLAGLARQCGQIEARCAERGGPPTEAERAALVASWTEASERIRSLLGHSLGRSVEVEPDDLASLRAALRARVPHAELEAMVRRWSTEPAGRHLARFGVEARAIAQRLGLGEIEVVVDADRVDLERRPLAPFWSSMRHVVRNAVDHGLGGVAEGPRRLTLAARRAAGQVLVSVGDTGHGVDWQAVRQRARQLGYPCERQADLVDAMFRDGLSTRGEVSDLSGRGVGLGAVREACREIGARIDVSSDPATGTRFDFWIPAHLAA